MPSSAATDFVRACSVEELKQRKRLVFKHGRKQIAVFWTENGIHACNNRCPHEGYPLSVGTLGQDCVLTCNWHNWKFDLASGETLVGGDRLRRYPVELREGAVWLDLAEAPADERRAQALANLREAFDDYDYERMARELARLHASGAGDLDGLAAAVGWSHDRLEFGTTHAQAAAADWLALRDARARGAARKLVPLVEAVAHFSWDTLREPVYAYPKRMRRFDGRGFLAAVEAEDEASAVAHLRGGLRDGLGYDALEPWLAEAALSHYQGFGHSIIYVYKTRQLAEHLGPANLEPLLLPLTRHLLYARREDLIPEFKAYSDCMQRWDGQGMAAARAEDFQGVSVAQALRRTVAASGDRATLYHALLGALAWNFLHFDLSMQQRTDNPVSRNIGWLDFTHGITFANAVRNACERAPHLWPNGLAQMACFAGRNAGFLDRDVDEAGWRVVDPLAFIDQALDGLFDHGEEEHIVLCHHLKTLTAARAEIAAAPAAPWVPTLAAALNRFLNSPLKRRHAQRTANQALAFVAQEA